MNFSNVPGFIEEVLTVTGSIMAMSERLMDRPPSKSTERRMENCIQLSQRARLRGLGRRHL